MGYSTNRPFVKVDISDQVNNKVGDLSELKTQNKTSLVDATNEVTSQLAQIVTLVGKREGTESKDTARIQRAIDKLSNGGQVLIPKGEFIMDTSQKLTIPNNVRLTGSGMHSTILKSEGGRTEKLIEVVGDNVIIENIGFDLTRSDLLTSTNPQEETIIEVNKKSENLIVEKCNFLNSYAGVWLHPIENEDIKNTTIKNNLFIGSNHPIYLGMMSVNIETAGRISGVLIDGNVILDGFYGSDGVKTMRRCSDIIITNNIIRRQKRDALDLYTSGDNVVVADNVLAENDLQGIDIKQGALDYPPETHGYNRKMVIVNNIIDKNKQRGISINETSQTDTLCYLIEISNNTFAENGRDCISVTGKNINISNNLFNQNCLIPESESTTYGVIALRGTLESKVKGVNIHGNQILNNGANNVVTTGIRLIQYADDCVITNNTITNDVTLENPNQDIGIFVSHVCENVTVKNNKVNGHQKDVMIRNGAGVNGEVVNIPLSDLSAGFTNKRLYFLAKSNTTVVGATIINGEDIPTDSTDFLTFFIMKRLNDGTQVSIAPSFSTSGNSITAYNPIKINNLYDDNDLNGNRPKVNKGELFGILINSSGAGKPIKNATIELGYVDY